MRFSYVWDGYMVVGGGADKCVCRGCEMEDGRWEMALRRKEKRGVRYLSLSRRQEFISILSSHGISSERRLKVARPG